MAYQNELESWWAGLPGPVHSVFGPLYSKADELLQAVAGDPDDLIRAGGVYLQLGPQITGIGTSLQQDAAALNADWTGDAYDAFAKKIENLQKTLKSAGDATAQTDQVMQAAAQAAVDGANAICDIVVTVIEFALGTLALAAATSFISFGASMAAWVASELAEAAIAAARVLSVVEKVAEVLFKVAEVLQKIAEFLRTVAEIFKEWAIFVKGLKALPSAWTAEGLGEYVGGRISKAIINKIDNTLGVPTLPGGATSGLPSVGKDGKDLYDDVQQAQSAAG